MVAALVGAGYGTYVLNTRMVAAVEGYTSSLLIYKPFEGTWDTYSDDGFIWKMHKFLVVWWQLLQKAVYKAVTVTTVSTEGWQFFIKGKGWQLLQKGIHKAVTVITTFAEGWQFL